MDLIVTILPVVTEDLPISPRFTPYIFLSRCKFSTLTTRRPMMVEFYLLRPTLMHTKNLYENGPNPFFSGFFNLMGTRMVQIRMAKSV